jgi:hypothetical protein
MVALLRYRDMLYKFTRTETRHSQLLSYEGRLYRLSSAKLEPWFPDLFIRMVHVLYPEGTDQDDDQVDKLYTSLSKLYVKCPACVLDLRNRHGADLIHAYNRHATLTNVLLDAKGKFLRQVKPIEKDTGVSEAIRHMRSM